MTKSELATARCKKGFSQTEMADKIGIAVSTYNQYENGARNVPADVAEKIATILETKVSKIFLPNKFTVSKFSKAKKK